MNGRMVLAMLMFGATAYAADGPKVTLENPEMMPPGATESVAEDKLVVNYPPTQDPTPARDRVTYMVKKSERGSSRAILESDVAKFCGDQDGCTLRLGMYNWDNTGRVASRESLLFYNPVNRAWRASVADAAGSDYDGRTSHVMQAWACYFTDGSYKNWKNEGDGSVGFGLLSWSQHNAECWLTIID